MNPSSDKRGNVLGYLAAFTMGVICAGVIILVGRPEKADPAPQAESEVSTESSSASPEPIEGPAPNLPTGTMPRRIARDLPQITAGDTPAVESAPEVQPAIVAPSPPVVVPVQVNNVIVGGVPGGFRASRTGARILGHVQLNGMPPEERILRLDPICAALQSKPATTRFFVVGKDHSLADVCVIVTGGLPSQSWPTPKQPLILQQRGCLYDHYVSMVQVNQPIVVQNRDRILHNLHITSTNGGESNRTLMPGAQADVLLTAPELFVRLKCDIHPWEFAYVTVAEHPFFALTDTNGVFVIPDLPPGRYTVEAHHRKAGVLSQEVEITSEDDKLIKFVFDAKVEPSSVGVVSLRSNEYKRGDPNHRPWQMGRDPRFTDTRRAGLFE